MARKKRTEKEEPKKTPKKAAKKDVEEKEARDISEVVEDLKVMTADFNLYLQKAEEVPAMNKLARNTSVELRKLLTEFRVSSLEHEKE